MYMPEREVNGLDSPRVVWGGDEKYDIIFKKGFPTTNEDIIGAVLAFVNECEKLGIYVWEGKYNYKLQGNYCLFKINDNQSVYSRELNTTSVIGRLFNENS